jgi:hypothetical protein
VFNRLVRSRNVNVGVRRRPPLSLKGYEPRFLFRMSNFELKQVNRAEARDEG